MGEDATIENGLNLWVVSDNLLARISSSNGVQSESLMNRGLVKQAA